jgi:hypothetical protein
MILGESISIVVGVLKGKWDKLRTMLGLMGENFECNHVPNFALLLYPTSRVKCYFEWECDFHCFLPYCQTLKYV